MLGWLRRKKPEPEIVWHVPEGRDDLIPRRATDGSMAYDLISPETVIVPRHDPMLGVGSALINTLLVVSLPSGYGLVFRSRSGLASKQGLTVEAGEIDSDYRGLLKVLLFNHSGVDYTITAGDRIAQARIVKIHELEDSVSYQYPDPDETIRGAGGFGSTGK
jgi:dUTP pyrophosphatase